MELTDTLVPPRQPSSQGTGTDFGFRALKASFGDGYIQDGKDGINPVTRSQTLVWDPITVAEADALRTFFENHCATPFYYRLPRDIAPRTWVCTKFTRTHPQPMHDAVTATLEERFIY
jgi:phage-related protein